MGATNYKNDLLIQIVERILPTSPEEWRKVALDYQQESKEVALRDYEDVRRVWIDKCCNKLKKPTGMTGAASDKVRSCQNIHLRILQRNDAKVHYGTSSNTPRLTLNEDLYEVDSDSENDIDTSTNIEDGNIVGEGTSVDGGEATVGIASALTQSISNVARTPSVADVSDENVSLLLPRPPASAAARSGGMKTKNSGSAQRGSIQKTIAKAVEALNKPEVSTGGIGSEAFMMFMQQQNQQFMMQMQQNNLALIAAITGANKKRKRSDSDNSDED